MQGVGGAEEDIEREFGLRNGPVVGGTAGERQEGWAEGPDESIEFALECQCVVAEGFGHAIGGGDITDLRKGVIGHQEGRVMASQSLGEDGVAIEVDHEGEGTKGREFEEAQAEVGVDEVEIVVEDGSILGHEALRRSILERRRLFECREDVDESRVMSAVEEDHLDPLVQGEPLSRAQVFDADRALSSQRGDGILELIA